jgi:large subunit ribosomal protein L6
MSKVGLLPIKIPENVQLSIASSSVEVVGPKGTLTLEIPKKISLKVEEGIASVVRENDEKQTRALHGTTRANLQNLITGVNVGFKKTLELVGTGYRARLQGTKLILSLGFSHEIEYTPKDTAVNITVEGTNLIHLEGINLQSVGQAAAEIRSYRKPEPYKGKGVKYLGEVVRRKAGKAAKSGA